MTQQDHPAQSAPASGLLPCPFCGTKPYVGMKDWATICCIGDDCFGPRTTADTIEDATEQWNKRAAPSPSPVESDEEPLPMADHNEIGRKVFDQPWDVQKAIITIAAHCTVIRDEQPTGKVANLAACISQCCDELATALRSPAVSVTHDLSCAADFFDDIEVDANGMCKWTDVANAQTHLRAALRCWSPVTSTER